MRLCACVIAHVLAYVCYVVGVCGFYKCKCLKFSCSVKSSFFVIFLHATLMACFDVFLCTGLSVSYQQQRLLRAMLLMMFRLTVIHHWYI